MANYTKGEWKAVLDTTAIYPEWKILRFGDIIATIESDENQEANARLIAAAPDMYRALKVAEARIHNEIGHHHEIRQHPEAGDYRKMLQDELRQVSQALSKAENG